jgi:hypothetical protein
MPMGMARMATGSMNMTASSRRGVSRDDPHPDTLEDDGPEDMTVWAHYLPLIPPHRQVGWGWFIFSIVQLLLGIGMTVLGWIYL